MELACIGGLLTFIFVYIVYLYGHDRGYRRGYFAAIRETRRMQYILDLKDEGN